jgi:hypothetical protein
MTDSPSNADDTSESKPQEPARSHAEQGPTFAAAEPRVADLSAEIVRAVKKEPGERVTCRRIVGDRYRCNWWCAQSTKGYDNPAMTGQLVTTHRVARSEMLVVTKTRAGLQIETVPNRPR